MNSVKLIGNVGRDISVKDYEGRKVANFSIATNESYMKGTEEIKNTAWHAIVAWGPVARTCETVLEKGKLVSIEGKLTYRQYQNKEDQTVRVTEILAFKVEEYVRTQDASVAH